MLVKRLPETPITDCCFLPLRNGGFVKIDPEDYQWLSQFKWFLCRSHSNFYAATKRRRNGRLEYIKMHRLIMRTPKGMDCHHVNHDTSDNRKINLQNVTPKEHEFL